MVDKVKPLKIETNIDGTQTNMFPTETNPAEDYLSTKGLAFENLDTFRIEKIGEVIFEQVPDSSLKPTYDGNGDISNVEFFDGNTQITANRRIRVDVVYDGNLNPTSEVWKIYDPADGTTVLKTVTAVHTWVGIDLTKSEETIT